MRILVIEDYPAIARSLGRELRRILGERVDSLEIVSDLLAARAALESAPADLLFLDLNLGGSDGFEVLGWATATSAHTIVVSANTHRAMEAFEHGVLDFVPKPVDPARLRRALERYEGSGEREIPARWLSIRSRRGYELVALELVRRIQAAGKYSEIHLVDSQTRIHDKSHELLEAVLPVRFVRVHRSHFVNLDFARRLSVRPGGQYRLELDDAQCVPVGRTRYAALRKRLS